MVSGVDYFFYDSSGGLNQSPLTNGPQIETPVVATLDSAVPMPALTPTRVLQAGQVWLLPATSLRKISYTSSGIREEDLAADGATVLTSKVYFNFSEVPLTGFMINSPEELMAQYTINEWIAFNNFTTNARWNPGAVYIKKDGSRVGDTVFAQDCGNSPTATAFNLASTNPCETSTTLDNFFPITLVDQSNGHPYETDFQADGVVSTVQGVNMWIANAPLPLDTSAVKSYRVFYELNGNVYMGYLEKDGTAFNSIQTDGSVVGYLIDFNQAAVDSVRQSLITGIVSPGSEQGFDNEVPTADLFGIGGHGVNGSLAPVDLRTHYNISTTLTGAGQTIAIVDGPGTGDPAGDLNVFSEFYSLPQCSASNPCFQQIDLSNAATVPMDDWGSEIALDTQVAHAIAPEATILVTGSQPIVHRYGCRSQLCCPIAEHHCDLDELHLPWRRRRRRCRPRTVFWRVFRRTPGWCSSQPAEITVILWRWATQPRRPT